MNILVLIPASKKHKAGARGRCAGRGVRVLEHRGRDGQTGRLRRRYRGQPPRRAAAHRFPPAAYSVELRGYDKYAAPGALPAGAVLCCATGAYGQAVSEHLFAEILAVMKKLPGYRDLQHSHQWDDLGEVATPAGANVLVLGAGDIGTHLAALFSAVGSHVTGVRRHAVTAQAPFERMATMDDLPALLPHADIVASVLPSTPATREIADAGFFAAMKPGAYFGNAGRGDLVDQPALISALESGHLAGAAIDVCTPEPLSAGDALWDAPNLLLTPHISGFYHLPATLDNIVRIAAHNIRALCWHRDSTGRRAVEATSARS